MPFIRSLALIWTPLSDLHPHEADHECLEAALCALKFLWCGWLRPPGGQESLLVWLPAAGAGEPLFLLCDSVSQTAKQTRGKHLLWIAETCLLRLARLVLAFSYWDGVTPRWPDGARKEGLYAFLRRMSSLVRRHSGLIQTRRHADFRKWNSIAKPLYSIRE